MVFAVIAMAAPLAATVSNAPLAVAFGDGVGAPGAWLLAACSLALFAVGFTAMSQRITNAGAFYAYVMEGLGRRAGVAAGYVALVSYNALALMIAGFFGYFASAAVKTETGLDVNWVVIAVLGTVAAGLLAFRGVEASVRVLMLLLCVETAFLVLLNLAVLWHVGPHAYTWHAFRPSDVFAGSPGTGLAFAFSAFLGMEATAVFGEEARDAKRMVRRATYIAVLILTVLYTGSSWSAVAAFGEDGVVSAARSDPGGFVFTMARTSLGDWSVHVLDLLVVTSMFAVLVAAHSSASRYKFALARSGFLPESLARTHGRFKTPYVAGLGQVLLTVAVVLIYALFHADPLTQFAATFVGLSALGVVCLEVAVSVSVVAFFWRKRPRLVGLWTSTVAPILATVTLGSAAVLIVVNFGLLTGSESRLIAMLPLVLVVAAVIGAIVGGRQERYRVTPHETPTEADV
ncbi:hypothetical protein A5784_16710 [Mycobacterium sp. 852013-50091_SCH5140682]|nr:hypothetical protein A5784_16710 [Mycobacterium sp. 852013-50091_SCH5140682]